LLDADHRAGDAQPLVGVAILNFNDADSTVRCLASLAHSHHSNLRVLVVDNGSRAEERRRLEQKMAGRFHASICWLDDNLGYARANNMAAESLFEQGCEYVLVLNDDTIVTPDAIDGLVRCARRHPGGGPVGPRVARDWPGTPAASLGERYSAALLWAPRSLLRYRRVRQSCYSVGGIMGCAMLFSRSTWDPARRLRRAAVRVLRRGRPMPARAPRGARGARRAYGRDRARRAPRLCRGIHADRGLSEDAQLVARGQASSSDRPAWSCSCPAISRCS
jgi:hypothetical protein